MLLLLLRCRGASADGAPVGGAPLQLLACSERSSQGAVNCEALVSKGRYLVLPISLRAASGGMPAATGGGAAAVRAAAAAKQDAQGAARPIVIRV
eukprot:7217330-Prymnesium_polylepis.1